MTPNKENFHFLSFFRGYYSLHFMIITENDSYIEKQVFKVPDLDVKCTKFSIGVYNFPITKGYITSFLLPATEFIHQSFLTCQRQG